MSSSAEEKLDYNLKHRIPMSLGELSSQRQLVHITCLGYLTLGPSQLGYFMIGWSLRKRVLKYVRMIIYMYSGIMLFINGFTFVKPC